VIAEHRWLWLAWTSRTKHWIEFSEAVPLPGAIAGRERNSPSAKLFIQRVQQSFRQLFLDLRAIATS
jgi:hypothetical protein